MKDFSFKKLFLDLLVVVCLGVAVWSGYVLFTHQTSPIWGTVILLVDIGVLTWNISVLRNRRWKWRNPKFKWVFLSILIILTVCAFGGVQPLSTYKDNAVSMVKEGIVKLTNLAGTDSYDIKILPGQLEVVEDWAISLDGGGWKNSTLIVELTITNLGARRNFGYAGFDVGPELIAIDSTGKIVEPWVPEPDFKKGELFSFPPYTREFYPNESWSGSLKFEMSPYSGKTKLYMTRFYHARRYFLFDLGSPREN